MTHVLGKLKILSAKDFLPTFSSPKINILHPIYSFIVSEIIINVIL